MLAPLERRILNLLTRGVLTRLNQYDGLPIAQIGLNADESHDGVEHFQPYGFHGHAPVGSHVLAGCLGGNRDHPIIIHLDDSASREHAINNSQSTVGDALIYTSSGNFIRLTAQDQKLFIQTAGNILLHSESTIRLNAQNIEFHADNMIKWDVGGRGYNYFADRTDTYETCTVPGSTNACGPPEHAPSPSEEPL